MTARIGIDCRLAGKEHAGIGRYIAELVPRVIRHQDTAWVLFFRQHKQVDELFPNNSLPANVEIIFSDIRHYSLKEQLIMPGVFGRSKLDLLHVPHFNLPIFYRGRVILTIHDLLWHQHRGAQVTTLAPWQYWLKYGFYKFVTGRAIWRATQIMVPSQVIAQTVASFYPTAASKIKVTYEGVATSLTKSTSQYLPCVKKPHQLLYVGSLYPHKNVDLILEALLLLPEKYELRVVSARSVFTDQFLQKVQALRLTRRIKFLGAIDDRHLAKEYQLAQVLIQPSKSEGFGLTGIEALFFRTPIIAADTPIFHEIYQDAALYFAVDHAQSLADQILAISSKRQYQALQTKAAQVSQRYSWNKLANQTWQQYQTALKS